MKLAPSEIKQHDFKKGIRGYNPEEVDSHLEEIHKHYEELYKENSMLKEKIDGYEEKIEHYKNMKEDIQNTLILAQNAAEECKRSAQKEADLTIRNANESAKKILDKANTDVLDVYDDYDKVKREFNKFRTAFRNFMTSQLDVFESLEKGFEGDNIDGISNKITNTKEAMEIMSGEQEVAATEESDDIDMGKFDTKEIALDNLDEIKTFFAKQ